MDYLQGKAGTSTTAFGYTATPGYSVTTSLPRNIVGGNGYLTDALIGTAGLQGYGNITYSSYGGNPGNGYGAGAGGGGIGGLYGYGGDGGTGASGAVQITYDIDSSDMMISGVTYNGQTGAVLPSVTIALSQGTISYSVTSDGSTGVFNFPSSIGISTGYTITQTISKAGYYSEEFSFVPYVSQSCPHSAYPLSQQRLTEAHQGLSAVSSGIRYGSSISTVSLTMTNTTGGLYQQHQQPPDLYYFHRRPKLVYVECHCK